jgi:hypothetical protein
MRFPKGFLFGTANADHRDDAEYATITKSATHRTLAIPSAAKRFTTSSNTPCSSKIPINRPKCGYQITPATLNSLTSCETTAFRKDLESFLTNLAVRDLKARPRNLPREIVRFHAVIVRKTEVWIADVPDHIIHCNGLCFLGLYRAET